MGSARIFMGYPSPGPGWSNFASIDVSHYRLGARVDVNDPNYLLTTSLKLGKRFGL